MTMKNEKGFTIMELLISLVVMAIVAASAGVSITQAFHVTWKNNDMATATRQAQNAGYWISHDAVMAAGIIGDDPATLDVVETVTLGWNNLATSEVHKVRYVLVPEGGHNRLRRQYVIRDYDGIETTKTTFVAENIDSLSGSWDGKAWKLTVTASANAKTITREYQVTPMLIR